MAFTATIYINGVKTANIKNNGRGGSDDLIMLKTANKNHYKLLYEVVSSYDNFFIETLVCAEEERVRHQSTSLVFYNPSKEEIGRLVLPNKISAYKKANKLYILRNLMAN